MVVPPETPEDIEVTDSIEVIEFDADRELFQATFDSDRDSIDLVVVTVVATIINRSARELAPLEEIVDTEALCDLFPNPIDERERCSGASFCYEGFEVTVLSEGVIEVDKNIDESLPEYAF